MRVRHYETESLVPASPDRVFAHIDDPARLASHMTESSWRMGGGSMRVDSEPGVRTRFSIFLPRDGGEAAGEAP